MQGNEVLLNKVLGGFRLQGTTLNRFCQTNGIRRSTADKALKYERNGKIAQELRNRLIEASTAQAIVTAE
jgi:hypothetical protein